MRPPRDVGILKPHARPHYHVDQVVVHKDRPHFELAAKLERHEQPIVDHHVARDFFDAGRGHLLGQLA